MGALIGKLGVPIQTSIAQSSLSEAYELCQNSGLNERNPRLLPMDCGVEYKVRCDTSLPLIVFVKTKVSRLNRKQLWFDLVYGMHIFTRQIFVTVR